MEKLVRKYNEIVYQFEIREKQTIEGSIMADIASIYMNNDHIKVVGDGNTGLINEPTREVRVTLEVSLIDNNLDLRDLEYLLENSPVFLTNRSTRQPSYKIKGYISDQTEINSDLINLTVYIQYIEKKQRRKQLCIDLTGKMVYM